MLSSNESKLNINQLIKDCISRGDSGYQSETRTSPDGDPNFKNDGADTLNKVSDSSSSCSNESLSPDQSEDESVKIAEQREYIVLNLEEEPKDIVNSSDSLVKSSSSDGTTTRRRMSFGGLCTISEDTALVPSSRVEENRRPESGEISAPRKISLMELEAQSEQRWCIAHNSLSDILKTSYPEKATLDLVQFQNVFRKKESLSALFSLFDWQDTGRINQELFVDTVKGRTSREPGSREWSELLEVLAYVACGEEGDITEDLLHKILSSKGVLEKLFGLLNKESDGCVSREEIMDFIANLTYARPRTGFTRDNLESLEKLFRQALGHKQELSFEDFKKIVHSRNSFFAERVFQIFDRDKSGTVSLSEFLGAMQQFAGQSPNDKFKFLFRVYDLDGDGLIQQSELQKVLQACMEENGMNFSKEQIEDLTLAMFEDADTENQGEITYEALKAQLEKHDGLLENLSISIDRWLVPPQPIEEIPFLGKLQKLKPYQLSLPYIKNNYVYLSFLLVYCCVNLSLFISRAVEYRESNGFTIIARACGQCLNFNCMFTLVLMLRQTLTFLRTHGAGSFLPLDQHMYLHKMVGWVIFIFSLLHALMHLCNFSTILIHDILPGGVNEFNCTLTEVMLTDCPQKLGLVKGWANPTGIILTIILAVMVLCSQPFVRKSGYFEVFYWTHLLYIVFFTLTILHGPNFWKWFVVPGVVFLVERTYRSVVMRTGRGKTYISSGVLLPSKVINLVLQRPAHFHFHPGDYVFVNIPTIAKYEWHPFTVSSAPEQDGALWLHIRAVGEWTNRLHSYFEQQQQQHKGERQTEMSPASKALPEPPSPRPPDSLPMVAITEEPDNDPAAGSNPSTPQRKRAITNFGFEADPDDPLGNPATTNAVVTMTSVPAGSSGPGTSAVTVVLRKPQPQKIQSTPNFFLKKIADDKKFLDRSTSVPNFYQKKNKEEPKIISALPRRTTSERRFDRTSIQRAQHLAFQDAPLEARFLNSADRSVAQTFRYSTGSSSHPHWCECCHVSPATRASFRYMRVKPTVITLDMPNDEDDSNLHSSDFAHPDHAADAVESGANQATGNSPNKNPKHVTVVTVESHAVKRANGHNNSLADNTLAIPGSESESEGARARRKSQETPQRARVDSRRTRRISRLEEAEALGQCIGEPLEIFIDGPYGAPSSHIFRAQHAVLIATGIGVTPFASILQSIMHKYWKARHACPKCKHSWTSDIPQTVMNLRKVDFFWINRDQRSFEWFVNLLSQLEIEQAEQGGVLDRFLDMHMYITSALQKTDMKAVGLQLALDLLHEKGKRDLITGLKTRTNAGRPNWDKVFKQLSSQNKGRITVFYCGPPALGRTLRYKCDEYGFNFRKEIF